MTDVGSVKAPVVADAGGILRESGICFIGSHPMAGSEQSGLDAARPDLFKGAPCIVTPEADEPEGRLSRLRGFWSALGARVHELDPSGHDAVVGRISHLPHLAACALTIAALQNTPHAGEFAGSGFRDTSRIASGDPELWLGILRENRAAVLEPLRELQAQVSQVLAIVEEFNEESVLEYLEEAKHLRERHLPPQSSES